MIAVTIRGGEGGRCQYFILYFIFPLEVGKGGLTVVFVRRRGLLSSAWGVDRSVGRSVGRSVVWWLDWQGGMLRGEVCGLGCSVVTVGEGCALRRVTSGLDSALGRRTEGDSV